MNASAGSDSTNSIKHRPCFTSRQMKKSSSRGCIKEFHGILAKTHKSVEEVQGLEWQGQDRW